MTRLKFLVAAGAVSLLCGAAAQAAEGLSNGGFETAGGLGGNGQVWFAAGWEPNGGGIAAVRDCTVARTGSCSAKLSVPLGLGASGMNQNAGLDLPPLPSLIAGDTPTLTFWVKGNAGANTNDGVAIRYLDTIGNILQDSLFSPNFSGSVNPNTWTQITFTGPAVSAATANVAGGAHAFVIFNHGVGPAPGTIWIDDVSLTVKGAAPVPLPAAALLFGPALGFLGVRRRKNALRVSTQS